MFDVKAEQIPANVIDLLAVTTNIFPSKGECRKLIQGNGLSLNKDKCTDVAREVGEADLLGGKYLLVQKGKKDYFIIRLVK